MLLDGAALPSGSRLIPDVCIVGAGAAGLTVAQELARHPLRTLVVESGGRTLRPATQRLCEGEISGRPHYPLDGCRFRVLGGTSHLWGGWCRPLDAIDFEERAWVPDSGWPFSRGELEPWYKQAQALCRLGPYDYDSRTEPRQAGWADEEDFEAAIFHIQPTRFGELYGLPLRASERVDLLLNANVTEVVMDRAGETARELRVATLCGRRFSIEAGIVVLACGGIENARLLLCSRGQDPRGVGNQQDLVGRYFADHLHAPVGVLPMTDQLRDFYWLREGREAPVRGAVCLRERCQRRERALGFAVTLHNADDPHDVFSLAQRHPSHLSLHALAYAVRHRQKPGRPLHHLGNVVRHLPEVSRVAYRRFVKPARRRVLVGCRAEQAPNRDSRVTLAESHDAFGQPRARLDWRLLPQDLDSLRRARELLAEAFRARSLDLGPVGAEGSDGWESLLAGGAHHMGTTRMHRDPRLGVVNEDCRVHGTGNLYVAGTSVFPTGGWATPVLTIVALALRLAAHLVR